jgi:hypothetical protein
MMGRLVFLLEEPSMKLLLEGLLPRLMPGWVAGQHFLCVAHQGKSDLDLSIPRKLSAWQYPGDRFVNRSHSYGKFVSGVQRVLSEMGSSSA